MNNCLVRSNYSIRPRWTRIIHQAKQVVDDFWQKFPFNYFLFFSNWIKKKTSFTQQCLIKKKTDGLHLWIGKQLTLSHDTNHFRQKDFFGLWMLWDLSKRGKVLYPNVCKDMQKKMFKDKRPLIQTVYKGWMYLARHQSLFSSMRGRWVLIQQCLGNRKVVAP